MTRDKDFGAFATALTGCAEALDGVLSPARIDLYFTALDTLSIDDVRRGIEACMRGSRFFPKPVEIREAAIGSVDDKGEMAWSAFMHAIEETGTYRSVMFEDKIIHAIAEAMGGWDEQWQLERMDLHELGFKRNEFVRLYKALGRNLPGVEPKRLVGQAEIANRATRGTWTRGLDHVDPTLVLGLRGEVVGEMVPALPETTEHAEIPAFVQAVLDSGRVAQPVTDEDHEKRKLDELRKFRVHFSVDSSATSQVESSLWETRDDDRSPAVQAQDPSGRKNQARDQGDERQGSLLPERDRVLRDAAGVDRC